MEDSRDKAMPRVILVLGLLAIVSFVGLHFYSYESVQAEDGRLYVVQKGTGKVFDVESRRMISPSDYESIAENKKFHKSISILTDDGAVQVKAVAKCLEGKVLYRVDLELETPADKELDDSFYEEIRSIGEQKVNLTFYDEDDMFLFKYPVWFEGGTKIVDDQDHGVGLYQEGAFDGESRLLRQVSRIDITYSGF